MSLRSDGFPEDVRRAHDKSSHHREEVLASALCGCFYCLRTFPPGDIKEWIDERRSMRAGQTAMCPHCGIDAVIGDKAGFELTKEFLERMNSFWFSMPSEDETDTDDED